MNIEQPNQKKFIQRPALQFKLPRGSGILAFALTLAAPAATAQVADPDFPSATELKQLSLEELLQLEVTSVSKQAEPLNQAASAVQVVTGEDIRRSGAPNLAEALRLAPNLNVQRINSHAWAISSRGFNSLYANKLLVMIDGRSVYTPLYAGVLWDVQNVLLEDVDRIEVVSGPGGTLWGANAVNGVINVLTKSAEETQGLYLSAAAGSLWDDFGAARYGGQVGSNLFYRVYGQRFSVDGTRRPSGGENRNAWYMAQGGFRIDYKTSETDTLTLQGDLYQGKEYSSPIQDTRLDGQNILGRWHSARADDSDLQLKMYFDRTWRWDVPSTIEDEMLTYDIDFQHRLPSSDRHNLMWGLNYRLMHNDIESHSPFVGFHPGQRNMQLFSGFLHDEISLVPERLLLTVGTKLEHNDFSGFELQPNARLAWTLNERHTIWTAVSRAVRSPSRMDVDYHIPRTPPFAVAGGPDFDSEELVAYELGYRVQPAENLGVSIATFYNDYDRLYSVEPVDPSAPTPVYTIQNGTKGHSWGAELSMTYQALDWWRLRGGYTYFEKDLRSRPGHDVAPAVLASLGNDPEHQVVLQSMMDLPRGFEFDLVGRYVDSLEDPRVPSYLLFDVRLAWRAEEVELAVGGRHIGDNQHPEFAPGDELPHTFYAKMTWRY